ncbi:hypothetical protein R1flu_019710 [Riccia fluitans]|uniref:F-box protein GID2 n=1 Tax=Riccia fluitans TaxID=41844 RepID=A0ABD1ZJU0_9MARC
MVSLVMECEQQQLLDRNREKRWIARKGAKRQKIAHAVAIDGNDDVFYEVMKHLDAKSLAVASCVSKQWRKVAEDESLWENLCFQHWPSPEARQKQLRSVVLALGGFRRLYVLCVRPLLARTRPQQSHGLPSNYLKERSNHQNCRGGEREWSKDEVSLSLSLFSIDCYERLGRRHMSPSSLEFLCKPSATVALGGHRMLSFGQPASTMRWELLGIGVLGPRVSVQRNYRAREWASGLAWVYIFFSDPGGGQDRL